MKRFWSNIIEQKASTSWYKRTLTAFSENSTNLLGHLFDKFVRTPELQFEENIGLSYDSVSDSLVMKLNSGTYDLNEKFDGKVDGPASSVDNSIPVFDGVTGKLLKDDTGAYIVDGKVGIGTNNPSEKLHVIGNTLASGDSASATKTIANKVRMEYDTAADTLKFNFL